MSYNPSCFFSVYPLPFYMKDSVAEEMSEPGAAGERERESESEGKRESGQETQRQRERGDRDGLISTSSSFSSKPASRLQRLGRTRHVPSRAELPVCGQEFPWGARDSQAAPEKQLRRQTRKLCEVTNAHYLKCHRKNNAVHCKYDVACYS